MKLTIDQNSASLLTSSRFDQLVNEMDEIIRLSKEFIGLDKTIVVPIEINADTNPLISYSELLISGGAFKNIVETEINVDRMDSIVYYLNSFVIKYASSNLIGNINFWNNYINNFDKLMSA